MIINGRMMLSQMNIISQSVGSQLNTKRSAARCRTFRGSFAAIRDKIGIRRNKNRINDF